jgi:hypothetical protein
MAQWYIQTKKNTALAYGKDNSSSYNAMGLKRAYWV